MSASTSSSMNLTLSTSGASASAIGRGVVGRDHRHRRDDGGAAEKCLQAHGAVRGSAFSARAPAASGGAAAHQVEDRRHVRPDRVEPVRIDAAMAERGEQKAVGRRRRRTRSRGRRTIAAAGRHRSATQSRIEADADPAVGGLGGGDALDLAQHPLAVIGERAREQLALGVERHLVGALRGAEHRDHDADDGDRNDDADRHHDAQAHVVPTDGLACFADARRSHDQVSVPPKAFWSVRPLEGKSE